ncbi:MAG: hypothetical protein R3279_07470 [Putridiphycobacter sp.]|nr:hypothetical protein [Putridiphycobacter sp.]
MLTSKIGYQTVPVTKAVNSRNASTDPISLLPHYNTVIGIALVVVNASNAGNFDVELSNSTLNETWIDTVNHKMLLSNESVAPNNKFLKTQFAYRQNDKVQVKTDLKTAVIAGSALEYQLVFMLAKIEEDK